MHNIFKVWGSNLGTKNIYIYMIVPKKKTKFCIGNIVIWIKYEANFKSPTDFGGDL